MILRQYSHIRPSAFGKRAHLSVFLRESRTPRARPRSRLNRSSAESSVTDPTITPKRLGRNRLRTVRAASGEHFVTAPCDGNDAGVRNGELATSLSPDYVQRDCEGQREAELSES